MMPLMLLMSVGDAARQLSLDVLERGKSLLLDGDGIREHPGMDLSVSSILNVSHQSVSLEFALVYRESDRDGMSEDVNSLSDRSRDGPVVSAGDVRAGNANDPSESSERWRSERTKRRRRRKRRRRGSVWIETSAQNWKRRVCGGKRGWVLVNRHFRLWMRECVYVR